MQSRRWHRGCRRQAEHRGELDRVVAEHAEQLRQLPALAWLHIDDTECGDAGLAALLVQPMAGALASLKSLSLKDNRITDVGLGELAGVVQSGALPKLWPPGSPDMLWSEDHLAFQGNPVSDGAYYMFLAARDLAAGSGAWIHSDSKKAVSG